MDSGYIRVSRQNGGERWSVLSGPREISLLTFRLKSHAIAYARAISLSGYLKLFVDDAYGLPVRQAAATLTYRRLLN